MFVTVFTPSTQTDRPKQTVQTQIRQENAASDLGLHCVFPIQQFLDTSRARKTEL